MSLRGVEAADLAPRHGVGAAVRSPNWPFWVFYKNR